LVPERGPGAPPAAARALESQLRAKGRRGVVRVVPGVAAGFLDAGRHAAYDAAAAAEAWDALIAFLRAELE
jgi:dienelactone hydrolase